MKVPRFSLRTLLIACVVIAVAIAWGVRRADVAAARRAYEQALTAQEAGAGTAESVVVASEKLCKTEEGWLGSDVVRARALHVARLAEVVSRYKAYVETGESAQGGEQASERAKKTLDFLEAKLAEAEDQLHAAE